MNRLRKFPGKLLWRIYYLSLVISLVLDFYLLHTRVLQYHFPFQYIPQFFALLGFGGCILLILIAKIIGYFVVVDEDYFDKKHVKNREDKID
ncbi:MAG: hypothetical protein MI863_22675 [Desulfobacterales bacterium]|nr:hypothetical protein [Desulfobacterales bacterium]